MKNKILLCFIAACVLCGCSSAAEPDGQASIEQVAAHLDESRVASGPSADIGLLSDKKMGWGQGRIVNDMNQPVCCIDYQNKYAKLGGVFIGKNEKNICLTFDEGYENGYTGIILDTLKQKGVKAVFFVTYDYAKRNPELVKRMIDEGHQVGNHTWSHPSMPGLSRERMADEIQRLHDYVIENFSYKMTLFRPPMGEFSEQSLAVAKQLGYKSVFWSFAYKDFDVNAQPESGAAFARMTDAAHNGGIYLLHAVSKTNADILGDVIDALKDKGYSLNTEVF